MTITIPNDASEVISRLKADIQANLPQSNPYLKNGMLNSYTIATGRAIFDVYENLKIQQKQFFPQTASDKYLDYWGELRNIKRVAPTFSRGVAIAQGTLVGLAIFKGTKLSIGNFFFTTQADSSVSLNTVSIQSLSQIGGRATAILSDPQPFASGMTVTISGAKETGYNGSFVIDVISEKSFTYDVDPNILNNAEGAPVLSYNFAAMIVQSDSTGDDVNFPAGAKMTFQQQVITLSDSAFVDLNGLTGGGDAQSDSDYRLSVLSAWKSPIVYLNPAGIKNIAKQVNGVTRVFVLRTTNGTSNGQYHTDVPGFFTVYVLTDNNTVTIIPPQNVLDEVKKRILDVAPAGIGERSVKVLPPLPVEVNISISDIEPKSDTMQNAIRNSLDLFFRSGTLLNEINQPTGTLTINQLNAVISETVDDDTSEPLRSYKLVSPEPCPASGSSDITVKDGEILVLGTVSFL